MKYRNAVPVISTADVRSTVEYYKNILGFSQHFIFGDPPVYAGIERDGVLLYITLDVKMASAVEAEKLHPEIFLWVKNVDEVFEEHKGSWGKDIRGDFGSPVGRATVCNRRAQRLPSQSRRSHRLAPESARCQF